VLQRAAAFGVTRIANITGLDTIGLPVVMVSRPNARSLSVAQGKGIDLEAAKASGLMEAIELYHAEHIISPLKLATLTELRTDHAVIAVERLPRLTASPFHADLRLLWIEGTDLRSGVSVWVPYELVHMNYTLPFPDGAGCFVNSSTGLASGNHILEAISHGICECVERDATTLWHRRDGEARDKSRIDLATVHDDRCLAVLDRIFAAGLDVAVWDSTSDTGIPTFYCIITDKDTTAWRPSYPAAGAGCSPSREIALLRAMTESAQTRLTMIAGSRDDVARSTYRRAAGAGKAMRTDSARMQGGRNFRDVATFEADSFGRDIEWLCERLRSVGCDRVVIVDLTRPGLDIDVVRVIVPGLEAPHEIPGYVPGERARVRAAGPAV
jgi:ribosomal protein S12 methylthiotransferase accessory factor